MNILLVVHDFLPKHQAGAELYTYNVARTLQDRGHEVSIYTREYGYPDEKFREEDTEYNGIKVKTVYFNSINNNKFNLLKNFRTDFYLPFLGQNCNEPIDELLRKFYQDFYNPVLQRHFNKHLDQTRPDIIHIQHLKGLSASFIGVARKRKIPTVLTLHDYWFMCPTIQLLTSSHQRCSGPLYGLRCPACLLTTLNPLIAWCLRPFLSALFFIRTTYLKHLINKVDLIIAPSNFIRKKYIEHGISREKVIFLDNGIRSNLSKFYKNNPGNKIRFAYIGLLMPQKGIHVLVEAFNKLKDESAELSIYGEPGYASNYYEKLRHSAINPATKFMGSFDNKRVYEIFAEIDVLVVPSIWYENSPLTIHEAALACVPVITSNVGGMAELIERMKNGLLFKVGDANDLYEKMKLFIDNPQLIKEMKINTEKVKTIEENVKELESFFSHLVSKGRNKSKIRTNTRKTNEYVRSGIDV